jgi:outer membrane lipoprotein-sorting protein
MISKGFKLHTWIFALLLIAAALPTRAANPTAKEILTRASKPYTAIRDYIVDARLTAKSPSVHIPDMNLKVFFKSPDKVHVESKDGFALLPKQGALLGDPVREMLNATDLALEKPGIVLGIPCYAVRASFQRDNMSVDATIWVDKNTFLIRQVWYVSELAPSVKVRLNYSKVAARYWLPESTSADISAPIIPDARPDEMLSQKRGRPMRVTIKFSNYRVNTGLNDSIFVKDQKD